MLAYISHFIAVNPFFLLEQEVFDLVNICVVLTGKENEEYSQNITDRSFKRLNRLYSLGCLLSKMNIEAAFHFKR